MEFTYNGQNFQIIRFKYQSKIDAKGGAAPWLIGTDSIDYEYKLFRGDEYIMEAKYHPKFSRDKIIKENMDGIEFFG